MHTQDASRGEPLLAFLVDKSPYPFGFEEFQVFDWAHTVGRPIALIEMPQAVARKFGTPAARSAALAANTERTFNASFGSILFGKIASVAGIVFSQVRLADGAIHPAGGDEFGIKFRLRHSFRTRQFFQGLLQAVEARLLSFTG